MSEPTAMTDHAVLPSLAEDDQSTVIDYSGDAAGFSPGGDKSSKQTANSSGNYDDANSLRSLAIARVVDLIGEGEIEGIVGGLQGVYFNQTAAQNQDGTFNFGGISFGSRNGLPDQPEITGFTMAETPYGVSAEVRQQQTPIIRTIADENATAVRVVITIPALVKQVVKGSNQGSYATSVQFAIDIRSNGGDWVEALNHVISGKCTSPYQEAYRLALPEGGYPWDVRVRRISPDDILNIPDQSGYEISSVTVWDSYVEMVESRLTYPHSAVAAIQINALQFGSSIPSRSYKVRGLKIHIPSNYDPVARTYNGLWDGTFQVAWSNNPAWVLYELLINERWGLGDFIDANKIDVAGLYQIAQYCDGLVDDGKGGKEPRYTFNGVINSIQEAFKVVQSIATAFRGMTFWSLGQVFAVADMPRDPVMLVSAANTVGGFEYAGTALKARHSAVTVAWNNPDDFYGSAIELVRDADAIRQFGWRQTDVQAIGCTSRGQAYRYGRWILDTEQHETETVTYTASFDHEGLERDGAIAGLLPGDIVAIADPTKMRVRAGGRIVGVPSPTSFELDAEFPPQAGQSYAIKITHPDLSIETLPIQSFSGRVVNTSAALTQIPQPGSMWVISGTDALPRQFRVISKDEVAPNQFKITGMFFDPQKFARVEDGVIFDPLPYARIPTKILPPTNFTAVESQYLSEGVHHTRVSLSWTPGADFMAAGYLVSAQGPQGPQDYGRVGMTAYDIDDVAPGDWTFQVIAISNAGKTSQPVTVKITVKGWGGLSGPVITNLQVQGGGSIFSGRTCTLTWGYTLPTGVPAYTPRFYVRVYDITSGALLRTDVVDTPIWSYNYDDNTNDGLSSGHGGPRRTFKVEVSGIDPAGNEGQASNITPSNPAPAAVNLSLSALSEQIIFDCDTPGDADLAGYLVWVSQTSGFVPKDGEQALDVAYKPSFIAATPGETYYVRAAAYDAFSKSLSDLNLSNEGEIKVTILLFDPTPPNLPALATLTTASEVAPDGTVTSSVTAVWALDTTGLTVKYDVAYAQSDATTAEQDKVYVLEGTNGPKWIHHGFTPGKTVSMKARAYNKDGYPSDYGPVATITAALNLTPPVAVANLSATGGFPGALLSWVASTSKDAAYVEIWAIDGTSTSATPDAGAAVLARVASGSTNYQDTTLSVSGTRTYWARTVNTSGIAALSYSGPATGTGAAIQSGQLAAGIIDATKLASDIAVTTVVQSLPATKISQFVTLASDGKLYRWDSTSGAYVNAVGAVNASDIIGSLTDAQIQSLSAAKLTGSITKTQITDGAITTPKLATGAVTAGTIAAGAITASKLAIGSMNRMPCGDLSQGLLGVGYGYNSTGLPMDPISIDTVYVPSGLRAVRCHLTGTQTPAAGAVFGVAFQAWDINGNAQRIPVVAGTTYEASAYVAAHRCSAQLYVLFFDASNNLLSAPVTTIPANGASGGALATFPRAGVIAAAPANAVTAIVEVRALCDGTSQDPFIFPGSVMFAPCAAGQTELSPYVDPGVTLINGGTIGTNSINASSIVANSITAGQIAAGAISATQLAAGAVTADKIGVGLGRGNLWWGSDCLNIPAAGTRGYTNSGVTQYAGPNISGGTWQPLGMGSLQASISGTPGSSTQTYVMDVGLQQPQADGSWTAWIPCNPGQNYEYSCYLGCHRSTGDCFVVFADGNYNEINEFHGNTIAYDTESTGSLSAWARSGGFATAPAGAAYMLIGARAYLTGGSNPYLFATGFFLATAPVNQSQLSPYAPQSRTIINGGTIATGSITATQIAAYSITGDRIVANTIVGGNIAGQTITAGNIAAGTITGDRIAANTITAGKLMVSSRQIQLVGISFYMERDSNGNINNVIHWTDGYVLAQDSNGNPVSFHIPDSRVSINGNFWYIWFDITSPANFGIAQDNWPDIYNNTNCVLIATVSGLTGISVLVGGTIIDGTRIVTNSIQASQIAANQIQTYHMAANSITGDRIAAGSLAADKIAAGTINVNGNIYLGNGNFFLSSNMPCMRIFNPYNGAEHVSIGYLGYWTGDGNDYGIICRDASNNELIRITRSATRITGAIIDAASIGSAQIANATIQNAHIYNGAVTSAQAGSWGGDSGSIGITVRNSAGFVMVLALVRNDPNVSRTNRAPGSMQIIWNQYANVNNAQVVEACAKNMWLNPNVAYYWGSTMTLWVGQVGQGYHSFTVTNNVVGNDSCALVAIEMSK